MYLVRPPYLVKRLLPKAIWKMNDLQKKIYLTFDDGPVPIVTPYVLEVLKMYNTKATFFCVGENVQKHPEIFQAILNEKHTTGNHTFNHSNGWNTHTKQYLDNVELCNQSFQNNIKQNDSQPLFRPPYGRIKKSQFSQLNKQYKIIMWDVLSGDYDKNTSPEKCFKNVKDNVRNGSIIVFHDSVKAKKNLEYALPKFIEYALAEGFEFDSL
jgi:peptidoglycan/xylan/chitin deacetylase (PgdA/CDA1 family)